MGKYRQKPFQGKGRAVERFRGEVTHGMFRNQQESPQGRLEKMDEDNGRR